MDTKECSDQICTRKGIDQPLAHFQKNGRVLASCLDCRERRSVRRAALRVKRAASDDVEDQPPAKRTVLAGKKHRAAAPANKVDQVNKVNNATAKSVPPARPTSNHAKPPAPWGSASTLAQQAFKSVLTLARSTLNSPNLDSHPKHDAGGKNTKTSSRYQRPAKESLALRTKTMHSRGSQSSRNDSPLEQQGSASGRNSSRLDKRVINEIEHGDVLPKLTQSGWEFAGKNQTVTVAFAAGLAVYHVVTNGVSSDNVSFTGAQLATFLKAIMAAKGIETAAPEHSGSLDGMAKVAGYGAAAYRLSPYWMPVLEAGWTGYQWYAGTG